MERFDLPQSLTIESMDDLAAAWRGLAVGGDSLTVDASAVTHCTTPGIQLIYALHIFVREQGGALTIERPSDVFKQTCRDLGLGEQWV